MCAAPPAVEEMPAIGPEVGAAGDVAEPVGLGVADLTEAEGAQLEAQGAGIELERGVQVLLVIVHTL